MMNHLPYIGSNSSSFCYCIPLWSFPFHRHLQWHFCTIEFCLIRLRFKIADPSSIVHRPSIRDKLDGRRGVFLFGLASLHGGGAMRFCHGIFHMISYLLSQLHGLDSCISLDVAQPVYILPSMTIKPLVLEVAGV